VLGEQFIIGFKIIYLIANVLEITSDIGNIVCDAPQESMFIIFNFDLGYVH